MNVNLTPELEELVHSKVRSGRYNSASEVVREALRLMEDKDRRILLQRDEIRRQIAQGLESLAQGKGIDGEEAFKQLQVRHERRRANSTK